MLLAQAAVSDSPMMAAVSREAEPLMLRALGAYYVTDEAAFRDLRGRGWSFADLATGGNLAARSHRPLYEVARNYEQKHDWTMVARDMNVPADDLYVAANSPRYVMVRPTPEEEARLIASMTPTPAGTPVTTAQAPVATAPEAPAPPATNVAPGATATTPGAPTAVTPGTPSPATVPTAPPAANVPTTPGAAPEAATPPPATPDATGAFAPMPTRTIMTPVERVAASRLEMVPREPATLLRSAVATYYALPTSTVRQLESQGWALSDILIAGNLAHRSEASFEEVIALHDQGNDWNTIASRIGVAPEQVYEPTMIRRVSAVPEASYSRK